MSTHIQQILTKQKWQRKKSAIETELERLRAIEQRLLVAYEQRKLTHYTMLLGYSPSDEIWRDVVGYEGLYKVSDKARVMSVRTRRIMRQGIRDYGMYLVVGLTKNRCTTHFNVHILVARAFIGEIGAGMEVAHLKGRYDNCPQDLAIVLPKNNPNRIKKTSP